MTLKLAPHRSITPKVIPVLPHHSLAVVPGYKDALLMPPVSLQMILGMNSLALALGVYFRGFPDYFEYYTMIFTPLIWAVLFGCSGIVSLLSLSRRLVSPAASMVNTVFIMFLWAWLCMGILTYKSDKAFAYILLSTPLSCLWILAHALFKHDIEKGVLPDDPN